LQGSGANVLIADTGPVFQLLQRETRVPEAHHETGAGRDFQEDPFGAIHAFHEPDEIVTRTAEFSVRFEGANRVVPVGLEQAETAFNYYVGDQSRWRTAVRGYEKILYANLYDGIDLLIWGRRDSLKYEFHVAPGADWRQIQVGYKGTDGLWADEEGALRVETPVGGLVDDAPYIYQQVDGRPVDVAGKFVLTSADTYSFAVTADYDPSAELVIDPDLAWAAYLGGSDNDLAYGITADASGNALLVGSTSSSDFAGADDPLDGDEDAFVAKVTASGSLAWATCLGGSAGEQGRGIAVDACGNAPRLFPLGSPQTCRSTFAHPQSPIRLRFARLGRRFSSVLQFVKVTGS
jgi:hypothetical protein